MKRRTLLQASPLLLGLGNAQAQAAFPNKTIRYIVPVAAGGGSDMVGRALCERWAKVLGQSVVVDNIGGGGGVIASQNTARAPADGYTLMQGYVATHGTAPATRKLPYDAEKDFTPIGMIGSTPNVLCINTSLPSQNFKAFLDYVKQNPGRLSYGSAGAGSLTHLAAELFKLQTNSFMVHIPYRGIAPAITDLIAKRAQEALPQLGKIGLTVIGVSPDPMKPIEKFAAKYNLTFPLAADEDHKVAEAFGVWVEKSMYGKTYMGMERSSFLVDATGKIAKVWRKVKPEAHAVQVLEAAKGL
jgi:peroxiredoxin